VSGKNLAIQYVTPTSKADGEAGDEAEKTNRQTDTHEEVCAIDPDATMPMNARNRAARTGRRPEPTYSSTAGRGPGAYGDGAWRVITTISGGALKRTGRAVVPMPLVT
jgi:hypothetical protein